MKLTPEEAEKHLKGIPVKHEEDNDHETDKDDCLGRAYPGVSDED